MKTANEYQPGLTLYGAGGHCKVVMDILKACGKEASLVVDDNPTGLFFKGTPLKKPIECYEESIVSIGNCQIRKKIVESICVNKYVSAIHPSAIIAKNARIGAGTVVAHNVTIQSDAEIGNHCIINTNSTIEHDVKIHDFVHVASSATVCGECEIGEGTWIGAGTTIIQGIRIGKNSFIGAGSVVVSDIPDNVLAYGSPCRPVRKI